MFSFFQIPFLSYCAISYLVGALPVGYLLVKLLYGKDIRAHGSGNSGATNVARVTKQKALFVVVFALDAFKAFVVLKVASFLFGPLPVISLIAFSGCLLVGNGYSCFLNFDGGKGVATVIGILASMAPVKLLLSGVVMQLIFYACVRSMGMASVLTACSLPLLYRLFFYATVGSDSIFLFYVCMAAWIVFRHKENIRRFLEDYQKPSDTKN